MTDALASSGAGRFAAVEAVVAANSTIVVGGGNSASVVTVHPPRRLSADLVSEVARVDGVRRAIGDLAFPATALDMHGHVLSARGANRTEAHGWASAQLTPYLLTAGRSPSTARDVVIDGRLAHGLWLGERLRIVVPAGTYTFRISGIAAGRANADRGQSALFLTTPTAARLAQTPGEVNAIGVFAAAGVSPDGLRARLRAALPPTVRVLSSRHAAEADAGDPSAAQKDDLIAFLGTLGALAAVIAIFVVGSTFAFVIAQSRRELALLRTVGATPGQVRRLISGETLVLAVGGGVLGCLAGLPLASAIGRGLVRHGIAPEGLQAKPNAIAVGIAFASGLIIAELAVMTAAFRAGRIRPAEALLDAAVERRSLGILRLLLGLAALGGAAALFAVFSGANARSFASLVALLLALALALLAPVALALPATLLSLPLRLSASGLLASTSMATQRRRVGTVAAPIMLVVALAGTYAITEATTQSATQESTSKRVRAPLVVVPRAGPGLPTTTEEVARQVPGVTAAVGTLPTQVFLLDSGLDNFGSAWDAAGIDTAAIGNTLRFGVRSGSLATVRGHTIAISRALANHRNVKIGALLHARLADTTLTRLRVGAIYDNALGLGDILLPLPLAASHAAVKLDSTVFVSGSPSHRQLLRAVQVAVPTATVYSRAQYLAGGRAASQTSAWIVWLLIGLVATFAGIAVVNTSVIATADRRRELALVRLIGATRSQSQRMIGWEAALTTVVGVGAGALVAAIAVARIPEGQAGWHIVVPPLLFGGIVAGTAAIGLIGSLLPARIALRSRPNLAPDRQ
jgi:putative ABC transport system permease protein